MGILAGTGSCGDAEADRELYRVTREELDRGWIHGPLPQTVLGPGSSVTRRFPVVQGRKIRPIDDFTASLINLTNSSQESVGLHGAEIIAASLVQWFSSCHALGVVDTDLKVQSWDLWKAYKQLCLSDAARERTFMAIWNPLDECVELYRHCALPFGGRASVNAFCRASRSLWVLGTVQLSFFWTNYFDDHVIFSRPASSRHCSSMAGMFFKLVSEDKLEDFGPEAKALGLLINLDEARFGKAQFGNTDSRKRELVDAINEVLQAGALSQKHGQRLRGRLLFAESQIYGRRAVRAMVICYFAGMQGGFDVAS